MESNTKVVSRTVYSKLRRRGEKAAAEILSNFDSDQAVAVACISVLMIIECLHPGRGKGKRENRPSERRPSDTSL